MPHQRQRGGGCLHSLGDHLQSERLAKPNDRSNDRQIAGTSAEVTHECGVDLERVVATAGGFLRDGEAVTVAAAAAGKT